MTNLQHALTDVADTHATHPVATPPMTAARAHEIASAFDLRNLQADFNANPYPVYDLLRASQPVRAMPDGSWFLTRYEDLVAVYRDAKAFSSDKKVEFAPKYLHRPWETDANPSNDQPGVQRSPTAYAGTQTDHGRVDPPSDPRYGARSDRVGGSPARRYRSSR